MPLYTRPSIIILGASATAVSSAANTNENALATITVPAGMMGANGILRLNARISFTNNVNVKTYRLRYSSISGTAYFAIGFSTQVSSVITGTLANRGLTNSQEGSFLYTTPGGATQTGGQITSAVDTTAATTFVISAQKATAGDTTTLESYCLELITP